MSLEPPPRIVDKFVNIWRDWLYFFWEFVDSHTGGAIPTPPATGTSWNAHGNTALGDATNFLKIENGSLLLEGTSPTVPVGGVPTTGAGTRMMYVADQGSLIVGQATGTQFDTVGNRCLVVGEDNSFTAIKDNTGVIGKQNIIGSNNSLVAGLRNQTSAALAMVLGKDCVSSAVSFSAAIGNNVNVSGLDGIGMGTGVVVAGQTSFAVGNGAAISAGGSSSVCIGENAAVDGINGLAIGTSSYSGFSAAANAIGNAARATSSNTLAVGLTCEASGGGSVVFGHWVDATATDSVAIGIGVSNANRLVNPTASSMYIGVGSVLPTLRLQGNRCAIISDTDFQPLSTLDISGSVGFKYTNLPAAAETSKILTASDDEYTFRVDLVAGNYTIELPLLSTADRRVYYFKTTQIGSAATGQLFINPNAVDFIDDSSGGKLPVGTGTFYGAGESMLLFGNGDDQTWWIQ